VSAPNDPSADGAANATNAPRRKVRLGELLLEQGVITDAQLAQALARGKETGRRLGLVLRDLGFTTDLAVAKALASQLKLPFVEPVLSQVDQKAARLLTEVQARKLRALPLDRRDGRLRVAVVDPTDWQALDELQRLLKGEVDTVVVAESSFQALLDGIHSGQDEFQGLAKQLSEELHIADASAVDFGQLGNQVGLEDAPVVRLIQNLLDEAVKSRASDIHIEPAPQRLAIRLRIDGDLHLHSELEPKLANALASRLKLVAGLDIAERRLPQDGRFVAQVRTQPVDIRISTLPGQFGESVVMRLLVRDPMLTRLDSLGLPVHVNAALKATLESAAGLVLVTGPTGSGKTTTLYAALAELDAVRRKIITAEDPVEYRLNGITQVNVHEKIGLGFAAVLRSALRQDPDALLIGEMRDRETVDTCLRAAVTGHLVLSTLHTNDALSAAGRLVDMGAPAYMVGMSLQLVIAQRLVRRVCPACAEPHTPDVRERAWLTSRLGEGWTAQTALRQPRGCLRCRGVGFAGRQGVYEALQLDEPMVNALARNDMSAFNGHALQSLGTHSLANEAARLAVAGVTTVGEAMRIGLRATA
jgi:MSHA biogenesis protein MshE